MIDPVLIVHQESDERAESRKRAEREAVIERVKRTGQEWIKVCADTLFECDLDEDDIVHPAARDLRNALRELLALD